MIKLDRSKITLPTSLNSTNTIARRNELIANGMWVNTKIYERPYKGTDVREALMKLSSNKCAFCEQILNIATAGSCQDDDFSREHFRPKSKYWWLAYSWDNLLPVCRVCNEKKDADFHIIGTFRPYQATDLDNIHALLDTYNTIEEPNYLHPEHGEDPEGLFTFNSGGEIQAANPKAENTKEAYDLDRYSLRQLRKKIYDDLKTEYGLIILSGKTDVDKRADIFTLFDKFRNDSNTKEKPFLAFRRYILRKEVLRNLILGITP